MTRTYHTPHKPFIRVNNSQVRPLVDSHLEFDASNIFARWVGEEPRSYAVYSYHWVSPIYVWTGHVWVVNEDNPSITTQRHKSQSRPSVLGDCVYGNTEFLRTVIDDGLAVAVHRRSEARFASVHDFV